MRMHRFFAILSLLSLGACATAGVQRTAFPESYVRGKVNIRGADLHYVEAGSGPTIVLIGGWPQTSYSWRKVMPALARTHRVLAFDLPGQGASGLVKDYDTQSIARYLHDALTQLRIDTHTLVGHDVGAWVAYSYAANFPKSVTRLVLMDAAIPGVTPDQAFDLSEGGLRKIFQFYWHAVPELPEAMTTGREREYLAWFYQAKTVRKDAITADDIDVYARAYAKPGYMQAGFAYYRAFFADREQNRTSAQTKLPMPVLALGGAGATADHLLTALRPAALTVSGGSMPGCGHYLQEECPDELSRRILEFLDVERSSTAAAAQGERPAVDRVSHRALSAFPDFSVERDPLVISKPNGEKFVFLRTGKSTCGRYVLAELDLPPGAGPTPHLHYGSEEWFFLNEGTMTMHMQAEDRTFSPGQLPGRNMPGVTLHTSELRAGQLAYGSRGRVHAFKNEGNATVRRFINLWAPGDGMVEFIQEFAAATNGRQTDAEVDELLQRISAKWGVPQDPTARVVPRQTSGGASHHGDDQSARLHELIRATEQCNADRPSR